MTNVESPPGTLAGVDFKSTSSIIDVFEIEAELLQCSASHLKLKHQFNFTSDRNNLCSTDRLWDIKKLPECGPVECTP